MYMDTIYIARDDRSYPHYNVMLSYNGNSALMKKLPNVTTRDNREYHLHFDLYQDMYHKTHFRSSPQRYGKSLQFTFRYNHIRKNSDLNGINFEILIAILVDCFSY